MTARTLAHRRALTEERAATDPILIIAGIAITLILLVGGTFAVSGFIGNANDMNAKGDLDRVATAQAASFGENERYLTAAVGRDVHPSQVDRSLLEESSISFTPSDTSSVVVQASHDGWAALARSGSGRHFLRTSTSSAIIEVDLSRAEDYRIYPLGGASLLTANGGSATNVNASGETVRLPAGITIELLSERWVEAMTGAERPPLRFDYANTVAAGAPNWLQIKGYSAPFFVPAGSNYTIDNVRWRVWGDSTRHESCAYLTVTGTGAAAPLRVLLAGGGATAMPYPDKAASLTVSPDYSIEAFKNVTHEGFTRLGTYVNGPSIASGETQEFRVCATGLFRMTAAAGGGGLTSASVALDPGATPTKRSATVTISTTSNMPGCFIVSPVSLAPLFDGYTGANTTVTTSTPGAVLTRLSNGSYMINTPCTADGLIRDGSPVAIKVSLG